MRKRDWDVLFRITRSKTPLHLLGFGDSGIDLQLSVWIDDPEKGINDVRSAINLAIWRSFKARGITIPFPQRDLHLKDPIPGRPDPPSTS